MGKHHVVDVGSESGNVLWKLIRDVLDLETSAGEWEFVSMAPLPLTLGRPERMLLVFRSIAAEEPREEPDWAVEAAERILREPALANEQRVGVRQAASQAVRALGASLKAIGTPDEHMAASLFLLAVREYSIAVLNNG